MAFIQSTRKKKIYRIIAAYLALNLIADYAFPIAAHALTNGPSQPEVQSFEPVGTTDMVDLFTGDFNYNIPLFELPGPNGGYPFNLSYHSGIGMDQEASWVGLGWNLNPGAIVRNMRGLPDDFNGQIITKRLDMEDHYTYGVGYGLNQETAGADFDKTSAGFNAMFSIYYNNYKGLGYSLSPGYTICDPIKSSQVSKNYYGLNLTIDSQEGVGVSAHMSHSERAGNRMKIFGVGASFSSRAGMNFSMFGGMSFSKQMEKEGTGSAFENTRSAYSASSWRGGGSTYSFAQQAYSPVTANATTGLDLSFSFKAGPLGAPLLFPNASTKGFFSTQQLDHKNNTVEIQAYGYNYLGDAEFDYENVGSKLDPHHLYDANRENDGPLNNASPNLATPNLTYDYYGIQGQGIGGSFRPYSPQVGRMFDAPVFSWGVGGSLSIETGAGGHLGYDAELSYYSSHTSPWDEDNEWSDYYKFRKVTQWDNGYAEGSVAPEPIYYKSLGEKTSFDPTEMNYIGDEYAARAVLEEGGTLVSKKYIPQDEQLELSSGVILGATVEPNRNYRERISRNTTIYPITNEALCNNVGDAILPEYAINYYTSIPASGYYPMTPTQSLSHASRNNGVDISNHTGGVTAYNADGNRYVYGLPVYNLSHHEIAYTAPDQPFVNNLPPAGTSTTTNGSEPDYKGQLLNGTEEFFSETNLGPYSYSHLLTGILGTDYVDLTGDGITEDDYGYWVKFNYVKVYGDGSSDPSVNGASYQWRAPYEDAMYEPGLFSTAKDDKGYIQYGEREMYHVATVETKTHIAVFKISERNDGLSANGKYASSPGSDPYYKLDAIEVYAKSDYAKLVDVSGANDDEARPIKVVKFQYTYDLCDGTLNTPGSAGGKLTLTKVWFEYQNNSRGSLSPYEFDYDQGITSSNPGYNTASYDRWANYKSDADLFNKKYFPYVTQFDTTVVQTPTNIAVYQDLKDDEQSVWNLREITLPTGGKITVDYEADDYAYVQHRNATQMFNITRFGDDADPENFYAEGWDKANDPADKKKRRIYFRLEEPILVGSSSDEIFNNYIKGLQQED
ncbi:MAG TPA: hypothetical protein VK826_14440, partial [Bacteroidia bacterium]|nr:hypothetical protein [Bacteroidia bacterium]